MEELTGIKPALGFWLVKLKGTPSELLCNCGTKRGLQSEQIVLFVS